MCECSLTRFLFVLFFIVYLEGEGISAVLIVLSLRMEKFVGTKITAFLNKPFSSHPLLNSLWFRHSFDICKGYHLLIIKMCCFVILVTKQDSRVDKNMDFGVRQNRSESSFCDLLGNSVNFLELIFSFEQ